MRQTGILILATTLVIVCIVALPLFAQRSQTAKETKIDVLKEKLDKKEKVLLIDVRDEDEVKSGSIPGSINLPMAQLEARMKNTPKSVQVVFVCDHGNRSSRAAELFEKHGYKAATFCALEDWKAKGNPIGETKKPAAGTIRP